MDNLLIQRSNARQHISENDAVFMQEERKLKFNMQLACQPPNSPDFIVINVNFYT